MSALQLPVLPSNVPGDFKINCVLRSATFRAAECVTWSATGGRVNRACKPDCGQSRRTREAMGAGVVAFLEAKGNAWVAESRGESMPAPSQLAPDDWSQDVRPPALRAKSETPAPSTPQGIAPGPASAKQWAERFCADCGDRLGHTSGSDKCAACRDKEAKQARAEKLQRRIDRELTGAQMKGPIPEAERLIAAPKSERHIREVAAAVEARRSDAVAGVVVENGKTRTITKAELAAVESTKPTTTQEEPMECSKCGKKLRAGNKTGICSTCVKAESVSGNCSSCGKRLRKDAPPEAIAAGLCSKCHQRASAGDAPPARKTLPRKAAAKEAREVVAAEAPVATGHLAATIEQLKSERVELDTLIAALERRQARVAA